MRMLALAGDIDALIADIRLRTPLTRLSQRTGWPLQLQSFHDCTRADLAAADVLIVQRGASARALRLQQVARRHGAAVVYEIDDLLTEIAPHISNQAAVQRRQMPLRRCMSCSDAVTVSTARLGRELALPDALEVPNYALSLGDAAPPSSVAEQPVTLLIASSDRLAADFIYPALRALQDVRMVVVGPPAADFKAAGIEVQCQALMPRDRFVAFARGLVNPLAVIPLEDSRFAACKSAIKWFDYGEAGIPTMCSAVSPYRELVQDGVTGWLVDNEPRAWLAALRAVIADARWRERVAAAARAQVRQHHTLEHTVTAWQYAIDEAQRRRAAATLPPASFAWRLGEVVAAVGEGAVLTLRRLNRARLARRR